MRNVFNPCHILSDITASARHCSWLLAKTSDWCRLKIGSKNKALAPFLFLRTCIILFSGFRYIWEEIYFVETTVKYLHSGSYDSSTYVFPELARVPFGVPLAQTICTSTIFFTPNIPTSVSHSPKLDYYVSQRKTETMAMQVSRSHLEFELSLQCLESLSDVEDEPVTENFYEHALLDIQDIQHGSPVKLNSHFGNHPNSGDEDQGIHFCSDPALNEDGSAVADESCSPYNVSAFSSFHVQTHETVTQELQGPYQGQLSSGNKNNYWCSATSGQTSEIANLLSEPKATQKGNPSDTYYIGSSAERYLNSCTDAVCHVLDSLAYEE